MPAERREGMDHAHYRWSPLPTRPPLAWPTGAPVAFAVLVLVEHVEVDPPEGSVQLARRGAGSTKNAMAFVSPREYGHRVGIFRVLDALARHGITPSVAIDAMAAERYPYLVDRCGQQGAEFVAHGISATRLVTSRMSEDNERAYIAESLDRLEAALGQRPRGWLGPEQSESERTPQLLGEAGVDYTCDWPNDEQPYLMTTPGPLVAVPPSYALDDAYLIGVRATRPDFYGESVVRCFQQLAREGSGSARTLVLTVRPWLTGRPFRMASFDRALDAVTGSGDAWATTTGEIASAFRRAVG
jgi:allantoinase